jgi:hypothetical protein
MPGGAAMPEDTCPARRAGRPAVVALPAYMAESNAGQIREELLPVIGRSATALITGMAATTWCDHAGADASRPSRTAPPPTPAPRRPPAARGCGSA